MPVEPIAGDDGIHREPTSDQVAALEMLMEMLDESRRHCTCRWPGQGALSCPSYNADLDGPEEWSRTKLALGGTG